MNIETLMLAIGIITGIIIGININRKD